MIYQEQGNPEDAWKEIETANFLSPPSTNALLSINRVAEEQGKMEQVYSTEQELLNRINIKYPHYSDDFYRLAYKMPFISTDISPYLIDASLTPEMQLVYEQMADVYERQGRHEQAQVIKEWFDKQLAY